MGEEVGAEDAVGFFLDLSSADEGEVDDEDGGGDFFGVAELEGGVGTLLGLLLFAVAGVEGGGGVGDLDPGAVGGFDVEDGVFRARIEEEFEVGFADFDFDDHADLGVADGDCGEAHFFEGVVGFEGGEVDGEFGFPEVEPHGIGLDEGIEGHFVGFALGSFHGVGVVVDAVDDFGEEDFAGLGGELAVFGAGFHGGGFFVVLGEESEGEGDEDEKEAEGHRGGVAELGEAVEGRRSGELVGRRLEPAAAGLNVEY